MQARLSPSFWRRVQQRRRPPTERLVRQPPDDRVPRHALGSAATAPVIRLDDHAGQYRAIWLQPLTSHEQPELVQAAEGGQISSAEPSIRSRADGSVKHVEVFRIRRVGTLIFGRPRPLSRDRRARIYTVNWEEPL